MKGGGYKVSVLMLTYNQEKYIDDAIKSVMDQVADFDFELVIGDDCSTDGTLDHCRQWQQKYGESRIVIFHNENNMGLQGNFIKTLDACRGQYVAICEGDDYWCDKSKLQRQVAFLDSHPDYSTSVHRVVNYYQDDRSMSLSNGGQKADNDIIDLAKSNFISNVSSMWRRGLIEADLKRFLDPKEPLGSVDYVVHMMNAQYGKIHYMNRSMAVYRKHGAAIWSMAGAAKQYHIAMGVRKVLMDYYKSSREDVYNLLLETYINNAVALMRYYKSVGKVDEMADEKAKLKVVAPKLTDEDIDKRINAPAPKKSAGARAFNILKNVRRYVSRLIPVPKPA